MRPLAALFALALLLDVGAASAQRIDPFLEVHDADPLSLAALVERVGDGAVIERFDGSRPLAVRLLAVRAARFLHVPEVALPALAELAASRDPDLAPAAMQTLLVIARALDRASLDAREYDGDELERARATLGALAADESARLDLRRAAEGAIAMLASLEGTVAAD